MICSQHCISLTLSLLPPPSLLSSLPIPYAQIIEEVLRLNEDPKVHGVYLHLPPASLTSRVLDSLKPNKDVDG